MAFPAKWAGKCKATGCGGSFAPGEPIVRLRWGGYAHERCGDPPRRSKKVAPAIRQLWLKFGS